MSQLTAVDISDSDRFELAEVLKEESESSSAPRPLEDILQETCDDDFDPMSQRSCYELLSAYIARPTATIESKNGHSSCSNCGSRQVTIYPYGQGATSYVEDVPTLYFSSATCKCRGCTAEIDGPQRKSIIEGEDEYNACIAALKTWNTRYTSPAGF